jgi:DNA-binding NarL/FixJ family response regulator
VAVIPKRERLLGRDAELEAIQRSLDEVVAGEARLLGVLGEAGIGKSALLAELHARADAADLLVLEGRAAEHERDLPLGLATDALDDHVSTLHPRRLESLGAEREAELAAVLPAVAQHVEPVPISGPAERFRYHRSLRALLELLAGERPVVLLLDDVHWADDASIELILHLIRRPPRGPNLIAFAARPVDHAPRLLDALRVARGAGHLALEPLDAAAAGELLADVPQAQRSRLVEEARGNPLYLQELARVASDPAAALPPTLIAAVQQELTALPPASRALLDGAAVAGDPFDPELAARAAGLEEDALVPLDRLVAADLIRPTGTARGFGFRHPVVRRAVYDAAPPAWRLAAHERVAAALAERGAAAAARAFHVEQCARPGDDAAIELLVRAAADSSDTSPGTAAHWYAAALALAPASDSRRRAELVAPMGMALAAAGRLPEARDALLEAVGLVPSDDPARPLLVAGCALMENLLGLHDAARRRLEAELPGAPSESATPLLCALAVTATFPQDTQAMRTWAARALETVRQRPARSPLSGAAALAHGIAAVGALWEGDPSDAARQVESGLAEWEDMPDEAILAWPNSVWALGYALVLLERFEPCLAVTGRGLRALREARLGHMIAPLSTLQGMALTDTLDLEVSAELIEIAEETSRLGGLTYQLQWALWIRSALAAVRGDAAEVRRIEGECRPMVEALAEDDLIRPTGLCNLAAHRADEDPERCIREMTEAAGSDLERLDPTWSTWLLLVLVRAALALGRTADAEHWAGVIESRAAEFELPVGISRGKTARAEVALAHGDAEAAAELALEAAAEQERMRALIDALPSRICAGRALAAAGREEEAKAELRRVVAEAERRTAWRFRDSAAAELRRLGVRLPTGDGRRAGDPEELTEREREIAALVADGRSNKQVAAALFLSEKTIEHHLSRVYAKLGVRSRTELAAAFARDAS